MTAILKYFDEFGRWAYLHPTEHWILGGFAIVAVCLIAAGGNRRCD